ncbi:MAG TPA: hypothetical protein VFB58_10605 [Chloroflexota bacterium]|nr:hypothetical protein [Chloroflexota bacterium]
MAAVMTDGDAPRRTVYVDPPFQEDQRGVAEPVSHPELRSTRWRWYFPWVKTAVSAPTYNGELLVANRTDEPWLLWHNYHRLGRVEPGEERSVRLVRFGTFSARQLAEDADYLLLSLTPDLSGIEIVEEDDVYLLRRASAAGETLQSAPDSTGLADVGLSRLTVNALQRIGVATLGELRGADLGDLWEVKGGPAAYAELIEKFWRQEGSG